MPTYFDIDSGKLLELDDGFVPETSDEAACALVSLGALLQSTDFDFQRGRYEPFDASGWQREQYVNYGKTVLAALATASDERALTYTHLDRAYKLGIGPEPKQIAARFGRLPVYREVIGSPPLMRANFNDWSEKDFISYAREVQASVSRKPTHTDYDNAARRREGPSHGVILLRFGELSTLHEHLGYPNIRSWDEMDFIMWAVDVMEANPDAGFNRTVIEILSKKQRGPSTKTLVNHFGSLGKLQRLADEEMQRRQEFRNAKIEHYRSQIASGDLPAEAGTMPLDELMAVGGRYAVVESCLPNVTVADRQAIARMPSRRLVPLIRAKRRELLAGYIESQAELLGVDGDIWSTMTTDLKVSKAEIAKVRERVAKIRARQRAEILASNALATS